MDFAQRLAAFRKVRGLTQQALADRVAIHLTQINRYETGDSQSMQDVIRRLAIALSVTTDELIFNKDERGPEEDMRLQFEAVSQFDEDDKELARGLIEGLILITKPSSRRRARWRGRYRRPARPRPQPSAQRRAPNAPTQGATQ